MSVNRYTHAEAAEMTGPFVHASDYEAETARLVSTERERIITRLVEMADAVGDESIAGTAETLRRAAALLAIEGEQ